MPQHNVKHVVHLEMALKFLKFQRKLNKLALSSMSENMLAAFFGEFFHLTFVQWMGN